MRWTRIPTWQDKADDWIVLRDGWSVGRTHLTWLGSGNVQWWRWAVWTLPCPLGQSETLEEALEEIRSRATDQLTASVRRMR